MSDSKIFNGVTKLIQYYISFTLARSVIGRPRFPAYWFYFELSLALSGIFFPSDWPL